MHLKSNNAIPCSHIFILKCINIVLLTVCVLIVVIIYVPFFNIFSYINILAVRKVGHLNIRTKMFDFEARVLIGWLAGVFASQPIRTCGSKSNIFVFVLRWLTFLTASIVILKWNPFV